MNFIRIFSEIVFWIQGINNYHRFFLNAREREKWAINIDSSCNFIERRVKFQKFIKEFRRRNNGLGPLAIQKGNNHYKNRVRRETAKIRLIIIMHWEKLLHKNSNLFQIAEMREIVAHKRAGFKTQMNLWLIKMSPVFIYFWMPRIIKYDIKVKNSHMLINMSFRQLLQVHSKFYQWNARCFNDLHRFYTVRWK